MCTIVERELAVRSQLSSLRDQASRRGRRFYCEPLDVGMWAENTDSTVWSGGVLAKSLRGTQVLVDPEPAKWQPVASVPPIFVQVSRFVVLPSVQVVAVKWSRTQYEVANNVSERCLRWLDTERSEQACNVAQGTINSLDALKV